MHQKTRHICKTWFNILLALFLVLSKVNEEQNVAGDCYIAASRCI